ncbi:DUF6011 domain-containing protein [Kitasatospora sp. NPDC088783]|uniref:DUF6011 domain-containing protein n=1 Tax=Kitasatospora sp. NPDC088783 TaxID=3364077 RepID=UPI003814330B
MSLTTRQATRGHSMDDDFPRRWWAPRTTLVGTSDGNPQEQESRFRAGAARVRVQAVKAATAARPYIGPITATFATAVVSAMVSSALDRGGQNDRYLSPSPSCQPTERGPSLTCRECGRPLTDELSQQAGYGPTCARYRLL